MLTYYSFALLAMAALGEAVVPKATLPPSFSVIDLGQDASTLDYNTIGRDGGGGGTVGGYNIIVFSDTITKKPNGSLIGFTSNSAAYSDPLSPTTLANFGTGSPREAITLLPEELAYPSKHPGTLRMVIWPISSIADLGNGKGVLVSNVAAYQGAGDLYNTLITVTANSSGPTFERTIPKLFYANEILYGSWGNMISPQDGNLLMVGRTDVGLFLSRVNPTDMTNRTKYEYYDASTMKWSNTMPAHNNVFATIAQGNFSSGDIFYSTYYKTWLFVYMNGWADSTFYLRHSLTGGPQGPWSPEQVLHKTTPSPSVYNYAGHAYWAYEGMRSGNGAGQSVLLSWTYNMETTKMAKVTFN